jgi:hypothetical protein
VVNADATKVTKQLCLTDPLQTLAKGDKLTVTVERIDGRKLRCTGATWSDAVVIYPGEALALVNIERQVLSSAPRLPRVWCRPPRRHPRSREDDFEAPPGEAGRHRVPGVSRPRRGAPTSRPMRFRSPPTRGVAPPDPTRESAHRRAHRRGQAPMHGRDVVTVERHRC